ncbi:hypothetical protein LOK49_LG09G01343 [Camellia lanceoleosa]|uniref:Uncharacterized protein n=1 Tax=Camellia lanceoleosa TaxID=1840588 RepID=A0ACC0GHN1_9ERIC|nr:hypothetical protein LOK49_LG09G01343 [Camellia lanceoleosa]
MVPELLDWFAALLLVCSLARLVCCPPGCGLVGVACVFFSVEWLVLFWYLIWFCFGLLLFSLSAILQGWFAAPMVFDLVLFWIAGGAFLLSWYLPGVCFVLVCLEYAVSCCPPAVQGLLLLLWIKLLSINSFTLAQTTLLFFLCRPPLIKLAHYVEIGHCR